MTLQASAQADLRAFLDRIERLEAEKKEVADSIKEVYAAVTSAGFDAATLRKVVAMRKVDAADREASETLLDVYLHAVGMASEVPLFSAVGAMAVDLTARESVIEAFKTLVPNEAEIIVKIGGKPVRLWRGDDGVARAEDYVEAKAAPKASPRKKPGDVITGVFKGGKADEPGDRVKEIADRAQERADANKPKSETPPEKVE